MNKLLAILLFTYPFVFIQAQMEDFTRIRTEVHFDRLLQDWDGFGFNYVEEAQYRDIRNKRQDYGGFSYLNEESRDEIIDMVFGEEGLKPGLLKMFLDPFHQEQAGGIYDHLSTTARMLEFVEKGCSISAAQGRPLSIITTLYGPPAYMTRQKVLRGRDLDPAHREDLAQYLCDWAAFLVNERNLPLQWISLHNEGDDWQRWPQDGGDGPEHFNHDYNLYWPPEQVVDFLEFLPEHLDKAGLGHIGISPGECYGWDRFADYGYASAISRNPAALEALGLVTSHGFISWGWKRWNPQHTSRGIDIIRAEKPGMHAWVTSTSWGSMGTEFIRQIYSNIYTSKVNAIIPWAGIQRPGLWVGGDPNAGSAFHVFDNGSYAVRKGYYFYKQVCRAGQPGMAIAETISMDAEIKIIAFAGKDSLNPDAFILINMGDKAKDVHIKISGSRSRSFEIFRSMDDESELYHSAGTFKCSTGGLSYTAPAMSVSTFYAR